MLKIRLALTGRKKDHKYRIVVSEARSKRDGRVIDNLGFWDPKLKKISIKSDLYKSWVQKGANPTAAVDRLLGSKSVNERTT